MRIKLPKFECLRCGHKWSPRNDEMPLRCAFCKSPYWKKAAEKAGAPGHKHEQECMGCREKR